MGFDIERHRSLLIAALNSHVEHLDAEQDVVEGLSAASDRRAARSRIIRERAYALDLARDLECS